MFFNLKTSLFRLTEWLVVVYRYYRLNGLLVIVDVLMAAYYLFKNPHRVSKAFLQSQGADNVYAYGETPLTTMDQIATECGILSHDILYEMGCGSGRSCFWLNLFVKCRVVGIDHVPEFIQKAKRIKQRMHLSHIDFLQEDMFYTDLSAASVIYLYGTSLKDELIIKLVNQFESLQRGTRIITVSYPLTDYSTLFRVEKEFIAPFPWGKAFVFLNIKNA